jgi:hypothetical protein
MKNVFLGIAAIAAVVAIGGVVYLGTGANQQASVGNLLARASTSKPIIKPTKDPSSGIYSSERVGADSNTVETAGISKIPTTVYPGLEKEAKAYIDSLAALQKKVQTLTPSSEERKRQMYFLGNGWCMTTGPLGGNVHIFPC